MHAGVAYRRIGHAASVWVAAKRCKRGSWMAEFGETPEPVLHTAKAILLINFCLLEVNKSPWDTVIATARAGNRAAHFATLELAAIWVIRKIYLPV